MTRDLLNEDLLTDDERIYERTIRGELYYYCNLFWLTYKSKEELKSDDTSKDIYSHAKSKYTLYNYPIKIVFPEVNLGAPYHMYIGIVKDAERFYYDFRKGTMESVKKLRKLIKKNKYDDLHYTVDYMLSINPLSKYSEVAQILSMNEEGSRGERAYRALNDVNNKLIYLENICRVPMMHQETADTIEELYELWYNFRYEERSALLFYIHSLIKNIFNADLMIDADGFWILTKKEQIIEASASRWEDMYSRGAPQ